MINQVSNRKRMLPVILICAFMVKNVATRTATATLGTTSCVSIGDKVKLICTVSADCCTLLPRVWQKDGGGPSLLTDGTSSNISKYEEEFNGGNTGFNLIIKNVQTSDLGVNYKCVYGATESALFYLNDILCTGVPATSNLGDCGECGGRDYGWSILGDVIGTVIILIIAKFKSGELKITLIVGGLTFIISAVVNALIAVPIGYFVCHCVDGTDPVLIVLGLITSGIIGVIVFIIAINKQKQGSVELGQDQKSSGQKSNQDGDELKEKDEKSQPIAK